MAEWFEGFFDGLYAKVLPKTFDEAETSEHVRIVRRLLKARKGQRVLDVPCGMGRLTIPLAQTGLVMTGVDFTTSYLRRARRHTRQEGLDIRFVRSDMREIGLPVPPSTPNSNDRRAVAPPTFAAIAWSTEIPPP